MRSAHVKGVGAGHDQRRADCEFIAAEVAPGEAAEEGVMARRLIAADQFKLGHARGAEAFRHARHVAFEQARGELGVRAGRQRRPREGEQVARAMVHVRGPGHAQRRGLGRSIRAQGAPQHIEHARRPAQPLRVEAFPRGALFKRFRQGPE